MNKVDEIKAFIQKNAKIMNELALTAQHTVYSQHVSDEIIEQQQDLKRHANRLNILSVDTPFFGDAEFNVLLRFNEFSSFVNLDECEVKARTKEYGVNYCYSIVFDNLVLKSIKTVSNEEHKKAQAI